MLFENGSPLVPCVNEALATLRDDGTLAALQEEWLSAGGDIPTLPSDTSVTTEPPRGTPRRSLGLTEGRFGATAASGPVASLRAEFREEAVGALIAFVARRRLLIVGRRHSETWPQVRDQFLNRDDFKASFPDVLSGFWLDLKMFVIAQVLILAFALLVAVIRNLRGRAFFPLRFLSIVYIDLFRGIPLLLVILLLGFGVPALQLDGVPTDPVFWGVTALVLSYSAYTAEVYRSGIESVHESQRSAARPSA